MKDCIKSILLVFVTVLIGAGESAADSKTTGSVEVRGIRIAGKGYGKDDELRPFNWSAGPVLALLAQVPGGGIIEFDHEASVVTAFVDDKGTNLMAGEMEFGKPGFNMMANISKDARACMVELTGSSLPAKDAKELKASGKIVIVTAKTKKKETVKNIAMKAGTKFTLGGAAFEVTKVGKPDWGDEPQQITLQARQDLSAIASVVFIGPDGKVVESMDRGTMTMKMNKNITITKDYALAQKLPTATIEMEFWTDMKRIEIPFGISVSVGL
ncbi:MAG TPA: hypothetical protein PL033_08705 [Candidatus Brocadiia bacterium]|nr:hypothetical protein [Candidatus Brocadiia bacterium]